MGQTQGVQQTSPGNQRLHFRMTLMIDGSFPDGEYSGPFTFNYEEKSPLTVAIYRSGSAEQGEVPAGAWICRAHYSCGVSRAIRQTLSDLADFKLPENHTAKGEQLQRYGIRKRQAQVGTSIPLDWMPEVFQEFETELWNTLYRHASNTIKVLRWRCGLPGPRSPFMRSKLEWSVDRENWKLIPITAASEETASVTTPITPHIVTEVTELVAGKFTEPAGWDLLREAQQHRRSNPRSALVLAIAAAEAAVADFIVDQAPQAAWLIKGMPKPPIDKLLKHYLPSLPGAHPGGKVWFPGSIRTRIKAGAEQRNSAVHVGDEVGKTKAERVLVTVSDLLWLLEYYRGHVWAWERVSPETRAEVEATIEVN